MGNDASFPVSASRTPPILTLWMTTCIWLNCTGWLLSSVHELNPAGYVVAAAGLVLFCAHLARGRCWRLAPRRRWRRILPAAWLGLAALVLLGGILHAPNNYDALAYRVPRVWHWLAEGQWHWIHTDFTRLNPRATGYEWLMAPFLALSGSERWTWIYNGFEFLLLPGMIFSVFSRLGVSARAAWRWMWVLPGAYGFALQAGGIANDFSAVVPALAMMHYALRCRQDGRWEDLAGALMAGGLMTGVKASNLPLLLPGALALLPCWRIALSRPAATLAVSAVAALVSFFPVAVLNWKHCGDWTGARFERASALTVTPVVGVVGNAVALAAQNFNPPILANANRWSALVPRMVPEPLRTTMLQQFEDGTFELVDLQNEEHTGFGLGVSLLVLASIRGGLRREALLRWSPWFSLLVYMATCGIGGAARIVIPYYLLLIPAVVSGPSSARLVCRRGWKTGALVTLGLAALLVVLTPARPLWPARTVCAWLAVRYPASVAIERMGTVYSIYSRRSEALAPIRDALPPDETTFGLVTSDDPEASLWRGMSADRRRFRHVTRDDSREAVQGRGIRMVVVNAGEFERLMGRSFDEWLRVMNGEITTTFVLQTRVSRPPGAWHLVHLRDDKVGNPEKMP